MPFLIKEALYTSLCPFKWYNDKLIDKFLINDDEKF